MEKQMELIKQSKIVNCIRRNPFSTSEKIARETMVDYYEASGMLWEMSKSGAIDVEHLVATWTASSRTSFYSIRELYPIEYDKRANIIETGIVKRQTYTVDVLPFRKVIELKPESGVHLISIGSVRKQYDSLPLQFDYAIRLLFDDIVNSSNTRSISELQAKQIVDFVEAHEADHFVIHCDAGLRRSVAIGLFMETKLKYNVTYHESVTPEFYNPLVYKTIERAYTYGAEK